MSTRVTEEKYLEAANDYIGWCSVCKEFTRESTEPDAEDYDCPVCGEDSVMGAEQALLIGCICIKE
jgi:hypothetical protein